MPSKKAKWRKKFDKENEHKAEPEEASEQHEETKDKPSQGTEGVAQSSKKKEGACGTTADEIPDDNTKDDRRDHRGRCKGKRQWETRRGRYQRRGHGRFEASEGESEATAKPGEGDAQTKTASTTTCTDKEPDESKGQDENVNKQKQVHGGRGRGASREREKAPPSHGKEKPFDRTQEQRPGRPNLTTPQHKSQPPNRRVFPGKCVLDLRALKEMDTSEVVYKLNESVVRLKLFLRSEEEQYDNDEFLFDLSCVLAKGCSAPHYEDTKTILAALKGSIFLSSKIPRLLDRVEGSKALNDQESQRRLIQSLIKVFTRYLRHLPSSYADLPYDQLKRALEQLKIDRKDELQRELDNFKQARNEIIIAERQKHGRRYINRTGQTPPNDFRELSICPTSKEIKSQERPFLRKNMSKGRYEDAEHYLDVQFRLLREDFLEPLREGIYETTHNIPRAQRNQSMKCYQGVRIVGKKLTESGIIHTARFDVSRFGMTKWAHSKRLIFGSLLCLSKDNFETMLFATVANRDPEDLKKGRFEIRFIEEQNTFNIEMRPEQYQMVESPAYFEAYRHVLKGLKELNEDTLPFKKYLVACCAEVDPPEYLRREDGYPVYYNLSHALDLLDEKASRVPVLEPKAWPPVEKLPLNSSQLEALRTAVTSEFSVIQGPPGTGKTYVGAKIVRCLLDNRVEWNPRNNSPMLMVCYTNHALDQFLEKVLEFLPSRKIIRVGGRCKSEQLQDCNLKILTRRSRRDFGGNSTHQKINDNQQGMMQCKTDLFKAYQVLLEFQDLEDGINARHADQIYEVVFPHNATSNCQNPSNTFRLWLCNNTQLNDLNQHTNDATKSERAEGQDGSILVEDRVGEDIDDLSEAVVMRVDVKANTDQRSFRDEQYRPKDNKTNEMTTNETDLKLKANYVHLDGSVASDSTNLVSEHAERQRNISQQSMLYGTHIPMLPEVKEDTGSKHFQEQFQWPECVNGSDPVSKRLVTVEGKSTEKTVKPYGDEEAITVEDEATRIQNQRCIEGEDQYVSVKSQPSTNEKHQDEGASSEDTEGWTLVSYGKQSKKAVWLREKSMTTPEKKGEQNQKKDNATKTRKRKRKKKDKKIELTADISNLKSNLQKETMMSEDEAMRVANIWFLSAKDRLRLYLYWTECYRERHRIEIQRREQVHEELCAELKCVREEEEEVVIRQATVVGMTTSCAAKYHSMLQRIAPRIVIIEEAAEVMEAHIVTSLSHNTKHTILIGDHKQLRPKATVYELAQNYNLEISLFERMVLNGMDCKRLCIQHRMRPEIAALTKRIYDHDIIDHETVCQFQDITGLTHNVFFIDHCQPEIRIDGLQSYANPHEATFLVHLCYYLLLQGYRPNQITILTMYIGQLLHLQENMPKRTFEGVKVCAVDNFQGEENDIILLSLVRSNSEGRVGFLGESNRICVSLSRARMGFYCIGNFQLLKSQCKLWQEICDDLETKHAMGETLQLVCKRHNSITSARTSSDFDFFGGCKMPCGHRLDCGHACEKPCHALDIYHDLEHEKGHCSKRCFKRCPNDHQCQERCHYLRHCRKCNEDVWKTVPQCGHQQPIPCSVDPAKFLCLLKCEKVLQCGHNCKNTCGEVCTVQCKVKYVKSLPCGHEKHMPCFRDPMLEKCNTEIVVQLPCEHGRKVLCHKKDSLFQCYERCRRTLNCGHDCPGNCYEDCKTKQCEIQVDKNLPCGHQQGVPCHLDPQKAICYAPCQRQMQCGHKCLTFCGRVCHEVQCEELCLKKCERGHACHRRCHFGFSCGDCMAVVNMTIPSCGHIMEAPCFMKPASLTCQKPCEKLRDCGHRCREICNKKCNGRPCKEMVPRTLPCSHIVVLPCHKNPERYKCVENIEVHLSCGHNQRMLCHVAKATKRKISCNEKVVKELHCKHKLTLPCHKNPEECKCKKKVDVQLPCGHMKSLVCFSMATELQNISCKVKVKRTLPCEHEATLPCYCNPEQHCCQEEVQVTLPCGHKKLIPCVKMRDELQSETCHTNVTYKLPCGHEKEMKCSDKENNVFCDAPCDRFLSCGHRCPQKCGDDCARFKCAVITQMDLPCGFHKISCLCSNDVSQVVCAKKCLRNLLCGHKCPGKCFEDCRRYKCPKMVVRHLDCPGKHSLTMLCGDDANAVTCKEQCNQNLECRHPCPGLCSQECGSMKCLRRVEKTFPCSHKETLQCFQTKTATCTAPCRRRKRSCKHLCKGICGQDCSNYPCNVAVVKTLLCGHNIEMLCSHSSEDVQCPAVCGAKLPCGHNCSGNCYDCEQRGSHEMCKHPCRRLLVCSHRCKALCGEPCPPCYRKCGRCCPHRKCKKTCSQRCGACSEPCTWSCPHYQCNNLCGEECDRPRCDAPCPKKLSCHHPCIGLCGENCPTVCAACNPKKLSSVLAGGPRNKMEVPRCLQLFDCGHVITVEEMDKWMLSDLGSDVQLMRCPKCSTPITFSYRYGNVIKRTLKNVENVKTQIEELENEVTNSVRLIGKDLKHLKYDVKQRYHYRTDLCREQLISWKWNPFSWRHQRERSVLFKFTFKNHLMILQQIDTAEQLLQRVCRFPASFQQKPELNELLNETKDALEKIKEYLEEPVLDLKTLSQVHEQTRKFLLFSYVLEAQSKAVMRLIPFSTRISSACDRFRLFLQGDDDALESEWLEKIVNLLRTELRLSDLPTDEAKSFMNFPGYQRGVWKLCDQGHVYFTGITVRDGEEVQVGSKGCTRCTPDEREEWYIVHY